jgi:hypothetical protein
VKNAPPTRKSPGATADAARLACTVRIDVRFQPLFLSFMTFLTSLSFMTVTVSGDTNCDARHAH